MARESERPVIAIVEDEPALQASLARDLRVRGFTVACFLSADAFLREARSVYGLVVVDLGFGTHQPPGLTLLDQVAEWQNPPPTLVMTGHYEFRVVHAVASRRVGGFLAKPFTNDEMVTAIDVVLAGGRYYSAAVAPSVDRLFMAGARLPLPEGRLSRRQRDVVRAMAHTTTRAEVAAELNIDAETVKSHQSGIYLKLDASSWEEAVAKAVLLGYLEED